MTWLDVFWFVCKINEKKINKKQLKKIGFNLMSFEINQILGHQRHPLVFVSKSCYKWIGEYLHLRGLFADRIRLSYVDLARLSFLFC